MTKLYATVLAAASTCAALAQAPFTIVRPLEGSTVREVVDVTMPKGSVPSGGFVGVTVDGKFLEATVPVYEKKADALVYKLDTKLRQIADGEHTIAVTLFMNDGGKMRAAEKSEVTVTVANHGGIQVPPGGLRINYKWRRGAEMAYSVTLGADISTLSEARNRLGGRAAQLPIAQEAFRMLFAVDDVKPGGIGLVRSQLLPYRGKDYLVITVAGDPELKKYRADQFWPFYQLLKPTGHEVYADVPLVLEVQSTAASSPEVMVIPFLPLPILPAEKLQVGDSWQANIALPGSSIERVRDTGRGIRGQPARGTFEAVEWEQGRPCARLKYELEVAERTKETSTLTIAGREFKDNDKLRFQQTAWISLTDGVLVRSDLVLEADVKVAGGGGQGQPGQAGDQAGGGRPGRRGPRIGGGEGGGAGAGAGDYVNQGPGGRGAPSIGGGEQQPGATGGGGATGTGSGVFVRTKVYIKMVLEK